MVVGAIIVMALECVSVNCWMSYLGKEPSRGLDLLTGGLVGSLTAMLVKTSPTQATTALEPPSIHGTPIPVSVQSSVKDPVHTEETKTMEEWNKEKT